VADLFDKKSDRWQRRYRYPLTLRLLFLVSIAIGTGIILVLSLDDPEFVFRLRLYFEDHPKRGYAALGVATIVALWCLWVSFKSWASHIIISPSSIKISVLTHGRQRVSWEHVTKIAYKRRLLGHTLTLFGTDGGTVPFRSSIRGYDELIALMHKYAPRHIRAQLNELLGEEEEEDEEEIEEEEEEQGTADEPQAGREDESEHEQHEDSDEAPDEDTR
jgi:hypothetical protein